jgi:23S rRNA pseudouridine1911/1915/1917 synthase
MITPTILYEDNHIIVAVKPAGVLSQAGELDLPDMLTLLKAYIKEKYTKPGNVFCGLVHRLDLNVGGIMVFARTSKAASRLSTQMANQQFHKNYYAVVQSVVPVGKEETLHD